MIGFNWCCLLGVLVALVKPLGWFMARVYQGQPCGLDRVLGPAGAGHLPRGSRRPAATKWAGASTPYLVLAFNAVGFLAVYCCCGCRACCRSIRKGLPGNARPGVRHGRQLRHEHELAKLRRRNHGELPVADAGADRAELRLGGVRHGRAGRPHSRSGSPQRRHDRQLLVRPSAVDALHPAAAVDHLAPSLWCRRASFRTSRPTMKSKLVEPTRRRRRRQLTRRSRWPWDRPRRRSRSSSSAPTAADSST